VLPQGLVAERFALCVAGGVRGLRADLANPGAASLASEQLRTIEQAMGSPLKAIWQHL
jgi:hypothetical protein